MPIELSNQDRLLKGILSALMRREKPLPELLETVSKQNRRKQFEIYNLCDGTNTQKDIRDATGVDQGQLSRTISKWEDEGIVIKLLAGTDDLPVHIYPIPANIVKSAKQ